MRICVTRSQFIKAHLCFVDYNKSNDVPNPEARDVFKKLNHLFLFDIKHVELDYTEFNVISEFWPKKIN